MLGRSGGGGAARSGDQIARTVREVRRVCHSSVQPAELVTDCVACAQPAPGPGESTSRNGASIAVVVADGSAGDPLADAPGARLGSSVSHARIESIENRMRWSASGTRNASRVGPASSARTGGTSGAPSVSSNTSSPTCWGGNVTMTNASAEASTRTSAGPGSLASRRRLMNSKCRSRRSSARSTDVANDWACPSKSGLLDDPATLPSAA